MTDNTEQAKQTSKYDKYCAELCPKDKLTEWFIKFYGENRREQITQKINKIPVMFIPEDVFFEDLMIALKEKNPNMSFSERKQETQAIINALSNVVYDQPFDMQIISKHRDILKELDFRFLKHPETKKLLLGDTQSREILEARIEVPQNAPKDELKRSVIALDMFIRHYNKVAEMQNPQYTGITIDYVGSKNRVRYFCYEGNDKNVLYTQNPPTIPKFEKLSEEEIHFLEDFIDAKMGSGKHGDTYPIYLVNNINKLFGKNHQTLLEARNDPELQFFFDFFGDVSSCLDLMISAANSIPENFTPEKINNLSKDKIIEKYYNSACYFINEKGVNASCSCETNHINIPLRPNLNMPTVVHEMNHALANEPNNSLDFNSKSTGFNEVVNEYFTQEIIKQIPNNEKEQYNLDARRCGYTDGVDFMKDFLDTYKDILIDCQFGNANETLKNFIGESNFNQLMEYGNKLEKLNYLQMVCDVTTKNGKQISSIAELMKEYKQDPSIIKEALEDVNQKQILEILNMENFLTEMVLRHKEFAQGHITDINLEQISSLEHTTTLTKTIDDD